MTGIIMIIIGVGILVGTISVSKKNKSKYTATVDAVVTSLKQSQAEGNYGGNVDFYSPIYSYVYNGQEYTYSARSGSSSPDTYAVGSKITLSIDPDNPSDCSEPVPAFVPMVLYIFSGITIIVGIITAIASFT